MACICFIESDSLRVPHVEPLAARSAEEAREEALRVLAHDHSGTAAHVFLAEARMPSVQREAAL